MSLFFISSLNNNEGWLGLSYVLISGRKQEHVWCNLNLKIIGRCSPIPWSELPVRRGTPTKVPKIFKVPKITLILRVEEL